MNLFSAIGAACNCQDRRSREVSREDKTDDAKRSGETIGTAIGFVSSL